MKMSDSIVIKKVSTLDWPKDDAPLPIKKLLCVGEGFVSYRLRSENLLPFLPPHLRQENTSNGSSVSKCDSSPEKDVNKKEKKAVDLLKLKQEKLDQVSFYDVLNIPMHATPDSLRKAYHKACLKYHPDKTGRGEEDYVFLKIKEAFDTLCDTAKRRSYDSSVDFDDSIPKEGVAPKKFYKVYGPVFERNLRFAVHKDLGNVQSNVNANSGSTPKGKKKKKKNNNSSNNGSNGSNGNNSQGDKPKKKVEPPKLGDGNTPIEEVNKFYDYWTHFESWRDFTLKATKETDHDVEAAECREEKRWMAKEIERKSKLMKKQEVARVALLVQRAMAVDPRLKKEKERVAAAKKQKELERRRAEEEAQKAKEAEEAKLRQQREEREKKEKVEKANSKQIKEKQKKALRKAKQAFRKYTMVLFQEHSNEEGCWTNLDEMNDEIELLCANLSLEDLLSLNKLLDGGGSKGNVNAAAIAHVRDTVEETNHSLSAEHQIKIKKRDKARALDQQKRKQEKVANASKPWTKEELSALAKGVKKYPPGGANRWDTIALFINNLLSLESPRSKEECIDAYNKIASNAGDKLASLVGVTTVSTTTTTTTASSVADNNTNHHTSNNGATVVALTSKKDWSEEQDKQLQEGLAKYPSSMDKNERWTSIAKSVTGKTKKECVERFKSIRNALKK